MTPEEERIYLTNLLIDSTAWSVSEGETRSAIELEVIDRLRQLQGQESINVVGKPSDEVINEYDHNAIEETRVNEHLEEHIAPPEKMWRKQWKWKNDKVRCQENGKAVWRPLCQCHKEKLFPDNPKAKKFRWVWDGPKDKQAQMDAMWAEHEHGE